MFRSVGYLPRNIITPVSREVFAIALTTNVSNRSVFATNTELISAAMFVNFALTWMEFLTNSCNFLQFVKASSNCQFKANHIKLRKSEVINKMSEIKKYKIRKFGNKSSLKYGANITLLLSSLAMNSQLSICVRVENGGFKVKLI